MSTSFSLSSSWTVANKFVVPADGDLILGNTGGHDIRWVRTADDDVPSTAPGTTHLLRSGQCLTLPFKSGDRIWMSANPFGTVLIDQLT